MESIASALSKAQAEIKPVIKDSTADAGKYKYAFASLGAVIESIREPMKKNDLSVIHSCVDNLLTSTLLHKSGNSIVITCPILLGNHPNPMQGLGSCMSYAKRYNLMALFNIETSDDDDAEAIVFTKVNTDTPKQAPVNHAPQGQGLVSEAQAKRFFAIGKVKGFVDGGKLWLKEHHGFNDARDIPWQKYGSICEELEKTEVDNSDNIPF